MIKRRKNDGVAAVLVLIAFIQQNEKTTVLKIRDVQGFALKLHSGFKKFDQNAAK